MLEISMLNSVWRHLMPTYQVKPVYHEAQQVTIDNLDELAEWCNGKVLGIRSSLALRRVELNANACYVKAGIGDWIVKEHGSYFRAYSPEGFDLKYIQIGN